MPPSPQIVAKMRPDEPASILKVHAALWKEDPAIAANVVAYGIHALGEGDDPVERGLPVSFVGVQKRQAGMIERDPSAWFDVLSLGLASYADAVALAAKQRRKQADNEAVRSADAAYESMAGDSLDAPRHGHVWMYHGTSSKFLPDIMRDGLTPGNAPSNFGAKNASTTKRQPYVFLTTNASYGAASALDYARRAAHRHGGDPVVLRIRMAKQAMRPDPDDADLGVGSVQRIVSAVSPQEIVEVDGERTPAGDRLYADAPHIARGKGETTMRSNPTNPTHDLHAFHVGHDREGHAMYVVARSAPGHRHDEYARMPSGRRALIVQRCGPGGCDLFDVTVSVPGKFDTEHRGRTRTLNAAVAFAKRYG